MHDPRTRVEERLTNHSWGALSSQGYVLGLDVGSYGLRAALADLHNHTFASAQRDLNSKDPETIVQDVISLGRSLLSQYNVAESRVVRIGVGFGGPVNSREGVVVASPRMPGWEKFPLAQRIEEAFGAATLLDNDANVIALAEAAFGAGSDLHSLFYLHLSSGVGGGLVLNRRLYQGSSSFAGEIGHAPIGPYDPLHPEGIPATLEERASIRGLLGRAGKLGLNTNLLSDVFGNSPVGQQVVDEIVDILAVRLAQITALIDPEMIILGGVVARSGGEAFINSIQERMHEYMHTFGRRRVPVVASVLGFESVAIGGIALALESLNE